MDQSSPPWRVFDGPAGASAGAAARANANEQTDPIATLNPVVALAGLGGAVAIGGLALFIALTGSSGTTVDGPATAMGHGGSTAADAVSGQIVVDVTGAVVNPGVYRLASGARVGDAIDAAGGFSARVDAQRVGAELNLASTLEDGAQVRVPSRDDPAPPGGVGGGGAGAGLIDLNTASQSELESLPGIGPVTAVKIMESRAGTPFRSVDDLRERGLVGEATFEDIRPLVTVG